MGPALLWMPSLEAQNRAKDVRGGIWLRYLHSFSSCVFTLQTNGSNIISKMFHIHTILSRIFKSSQNTWKACCKRQAEVITCYTAKVKGLKICNLNLISFFFRYVTNQGSPVDSQCDLVALTCQHRAGGSYRHCALSKGSGGQATLGHVCVDGWG